MKRKEEVIRQQTFDQALRIVKTEGIEALEARCTRNAQTYVPVQLDNKAVDEFVQRCKTATTFTFMSMMLYVLHEREGFGNKRLSRVMDEFIETADSIYYKYVTFNDIVEYIRDECGVDLEPYMPAAYKVITELEDKVENGGSQLQPGKSWDGQW